MAFLFLFLPCRNGGETWFGHVMLVFTYKVPAKPGLQLAVFVRWYCAAPSTKMTRLTRMQRLRWEMARLPGDTELAPRCDVISAKSVLEHVLIQREPECPGHFLFNHFVRVGGR